MIEQIKAFINRMNAAGIPMPVVRDPKTSLGGITATLVIVSSACVIASLMTVKVNQSGALSFYGISLAAYLGRKLQTKDVSLTDEKKE